MQQALNPPPHLSSITHGRHTARCSRRFLHPPSGPRPHLVRPEIKSSDGRAAVIGRLSPGRRPSVRRISRRAAHLVLPVTPGRLHAVRHRSVLASLHRPSVSPSRSRRIVSITAGPRFIKPPYRPLASYTTVRCVGAHLFEPANVEHN